MKNKITIIGAGWVGSTTAYSLITLNIAKEIALIDINKKLVESQVMDLQHSVPFWGYSKVKVGSYNDIRNSKVVVICCGSNQKPGETRLDLVKKNSKIIKDIVPKVFKKNPRAILLIVTNPVDILTYQAVRMFPKKKNQIFGSGTVLDSARFRFLLGERLDINPKSIHAYIIGEHGDGEISLWSTATIGNTHIDNFKKLSDKEKQKISEKAKNAAYTIIEGKQATYYAISAGIAQIIESIIFDKKIVFPVSHYFEGEYGIKDICMSSPVIVGSNGILDKIHLVNISKEEKRLLQKSSRKLKKIAESIE